MAAIAGLFGLVPGWIWASLVAASVLHGCWVGHQRDGARNDFRALETRMAKDDTARSRVALEANSNFRKHEHQLAASAAELEHANQTKKASTAGVDRSNRNDVDGVRSDVTRLDAAARGRELPSAAACPAQLAASRREAEVARGLFAACTAEYQDVASGAQRDAIDLGTGLNYGNLWHAQPLQQRPGSAGRNSP